MLTDCLALSYRIIVLSVVSSIIYTRWPKGEEKSLVLDGMDEKKVASSLKKLLVDEPN
jgi:hypothetical protein